MVDRSAAEGAQPGPDALLASAFDDPASEASHAARAFDSFHRIVALHNEHADPDGDPGSWVYDPLEPTLASRREVAGHTNAPGTVCLSRRRPVDTAHDWEMRRLGRYVAIAYYEVLDRGDPFAGPPQP